MEKLDLQGPSKTHIPGLGTLFLLKFKVVDNAEPSRHGKRSTAVSTGLSPWEAAPS